MFVIFHKSHSIPLNIMKFHSIPLKSQITIAILIYFDITRGYPLGPLAPAGPMAFSPASSRRLLRIACSAAREPRRQAGERSIVRTLRPAVAVAPGGGKAR